jgi:DNA-binding transcriptional LysR family regulator
VRPTLDDSGSLIVKNFGTTSTILVASPTQVQRQGKPSSVEDLNGFDTVNMASVEGRATWNLRGPDGATHVFHHLPRYVADDLMTLKFAVLGGVGMCAIPDYMCVDDIREGRLVEILPGWTPQPGIFHAVFPSRRGLVPAVRKFLDFLGDAIAKDGIAQSAP